MTIRPLVVVTASLVTLACQPLGNGPSTPPAGSVSQPPGDDFTVDVSVIEAAIQDQNRPLEDRLRDTGRKPADVLGFFGIAPGMTVLDFNAGTGYYTELLSIIVGERGHVIAQNHQGAEGVLTAEDFERRYGNDRLANTEQVFAKHNDLDLPTASLDAILMTLVYHDTYWFDENVDWGPVDQAALLAEFYDALKPGAVLGIVDHYAATGTDPHESARTVHRIDPTVVRRDLSLAGFTLAAESDMLRNSADDYSLSVFDESVSGATDRFVMRYRRPN